MENKYKVAVLLNDDTSMVTGVYEENVAKLIVTSSFRVGYVSNTINGEHIYYPLHRIKKIRIYPVD